MFRLDDAVNSQQIVERPRAHGRFLYLGDNKFFIKGVTYGPFPANSAGEPLPEQAMAAKDFKMMRAMGVNTVRVYYVPPRWFLDLAAQSGVHVMIGIPWPQHLCFLDQWEVKESVKETVLSAVTACKGHPAVLAYLIGNEIPSHIVRWSGASNIEKFLKALTEIVRSEDPTALVTYANYPSTEYLKLPFLDFLSFNVYLHEEKSFRAYVKRLQNVAGEMPLVLSEFGMDSMRHGQEAQANTLDWQVRAAFELGVSGTVVFAWTDEWYTGGHLIDDWAFGLVDAARVPKAAYHAVSNAYAHDLPGLPHKPPFISVVVCAYNADSTMDSCLKSFEKVKYPHYEVIVVDDGSTDATGEIADHYATLFPNVHVIHQPNLGLSAARNVGMNAAQGEIVAYTDSDCYVDPHWLHFMAWAFADGHFAGVGGPNLPPPEDNRTAACVAVSPGAPTHVLLTDEVAEHIPGCNMAFRKDKLMEIGGFDALYRAAGDDVDLCWRLQNQGYEIGFSAAMMVWHHRRNTIKAYLKQQKGYGRAEALLTPKHPDRFNQLGNSRWAGRIYGDISGALLTSRPVIYHGVFGMGLFQTLYEPKGSLLAYLPMSFEWMMLALVLSFLTVLFPLAAIPAAGMALTSLAFVGHMASKARLPRVYDNWRSRLIIALLTLSQPVLRGQTRYRTLLALRLTAWHKFRSQRKIGLGLPRETASLPRRLWNKVAEASMLLTHGFSFHRYFWNNLGLEREDVIDHTMSLLNSLGVSQKIDSGFSESGKTPPWDIQAQPGLWAKMRLRLTVENHGGMKRFVRLAGVIMPTSSAFFLLISSAALAGAGYAAVGLLGLAVAGLAPLTALFLVARDHFQAASLASLLANHMIACKPGSSLGEPAEESPEVADVAAIPVDPRETVENTGEPVFTSAIELGDDTPQTARTLQ